MKGIWEGDGSIVNCIEGHPSLPLVAVSGIDNTVKVFAPDRPDESELKIGDELGALDGDVYRWKSASRLGDLATILANNANPQRRLHQVTRLRLEDLALHLGVSRERLNSADCNIQVSRHCHYRYQRDVLNLAQYIVRVRFYWEITIYAHWYTSIHWFRSLAHVVTAKIWLQGRS